MSRPGTEAVVTDCRTANIPAACTASLFPPTRARKKERKSADHATHSQAMSGSVAAAKFTVARTAAISAAQPQYQPSAVPVPPKSEFAPTVR